MEDDRAREWFKLRGGEAAGPSISSALANHPSKTKAMRQSRCVAFTASGVADQKRVLEPLIYIKQARWSS
jgi:hypothetical protein